MIKHKGQINIDNNKIFLYNPDSLENAEQQSNTNENWPNNTTSTWILLYLMSDKQNESRFMYQQTKSMH